MKIRGLIDYDIVNYGKPTLFIAFPYCSFKCDAEFANKICQNSDLIKESIKEISIDRIIKIYEQNPLTKGITCGGLEPFDSINELINLIREFRKYYEDPIIIYTGYKEEEIVSQVEQIRRYRNIIIKYGRFIPNQKPHYDGNLGVNLASDNQYAVHYA